MCRVKEGKRDAERSPKSFACLGGKVQDITLGCLHAYLIRLSVIASRRVWWVIWPGGPYQTFPSASLNPPASKRPGSKRRLRGLAVVTRGPRTARYTVPTLGTFVSFVSSSAR